MDPAGPGLTTISRMDVSSSLSGPKEFRIVKRGYDPDEVDTFLDQISVGVSELKRKLAEASDKAAVAPAEPEDTGGAEEIHRALILAQRAADEEVRKATEEAESIRADANAAADDARLQADAAAAEQRTAIEEEVAQRREEGRASLLTEISELESTRGSLASDVVVLERHVEEQREVVQAAIGELQSLLDHPEAFRVAVAAGVRLPPPDEPLGGAAPVDGSVEGDGPGADPVADEPAPVAPPATDESPTPQDIVAASTEDEPAADEPLSDEAPAPAEDGPDPETHSEPPPVIDQAGLEPSVPDTGPPDETPAPAPSPSDEGAGIDLTDANTHVDAADDADAGPATEAVSSVDAPDGEDTFLAELRKAMLDDEPLGPREDGDDRTPSVTEEEPARGKSRFGRRR